MERPEVEYLYRVRFRAPRLRGRVWAALDVASLWWNWHARRHRGSERLQSARPDLFNRGREIDERDLHFA